MAADKSDKSEKAMSVSERQEIQNCLDETAKIVRELAFHTEGFCSICGQPVKRWVEPITSFVVQSVKDNGIDLATGHRVNCSKLSHKK